MAKEKSAHLSIIGFSLALGITWGIVIILVGWISMITGKNLFVETMQSIHMGYVPTFIGAIIGGIWGFIYGFIIGVVFSFFYNLVKK